VCLRVCIFRDLQQCTSNLELHTLPCWFFLLGLIISCQLPCWHILGGWSVVVYALPCRSGLFIDRVKYVDDVRGRHVFDRWSVVMHSLPNGYFRLIFYMFVCACWYVFVCVCVFALVHFAGTYNNAPAASGCIVCPAGSFCPDSVSLVSCPAGYYCPFSSMSTPILCPLGANCSLTGLSAFAPVSCQAGSYCTTILLTNDGNACVVGSSVCSGTVFVSAPRLCPAGYISLLIVYMLYTTYPNHVFFAFRVLLSTKFLFSNNLPKW
jgi:hypothetical protein